MSIKLAIILAVAFLLTFACFAGPVGSTSEWGIVITPCAWCKGTNDIEVHHIVPQHIAPERAHDTNNMVCLCRRCHFVIGHHGVSWAYVFTNLMTVINTR